VLRNSTVRTWERAGQPARGGRPAEGEEVARLPDGTPVMRYADWEPVVGTSGDVETLAMYAGQSAGLVREVKPAAPQSRAPRRSPQRALTDAVGR
jgi:nitronate monooxygenase